MRPAEIVFITVAIVAAAVMVVYVALTVAGWQIQVTPPPCC